MAALRIEDLIRRMGMAPELWDFRGQCYDCGEGNSRTCAITQEPARFCFTLKPKDGGKGRLTIGPASFSILRRFAPELYLKLEGGRHFLQIMADAEAADLRKNSMVRKRLVTFKRLVDLRHAAKKRIRSWRMSNHGQDIPAILEGLQAMLGAKQPEFHNVEAETRWAEQRILELERELLVHDAVPDILTASAVSPQGVPEIEF
jgi:hypothetical protein